MEDFFRDQYGKVVEKPADRSVTFRPSAYAVVINDAGQLLMVKSAYDGRYLLPGGGIEVGESIANCVARECREETGYQVLAETSPINFRETLFHEKISDQYYHVVGLFFKGQIVDSSRGGQIEDITEIASVEWRDLISLQENECSHYIWPVIKQLIN